MAQGSGRSIPAFHLLDALDSMRDLFTRYGGHSHAAGVTLEPGRVEEFRERFAACAAARLRPEDFEPLLALDAVAELKELSENAIGEIFRMAPFGHGNPPPMLAALQVEVAGPPAAWKEKHLKVMVRQNGRALMLKAWNFAARAAELPAGARLDIAFQVEEDSYAPGGWCAVLRDARAAAAATA
jgi:single-stranded-DNA-specific exonuclease